MYLISRSLYDFLLSVFVISATTVTSSKSNNETVISSFTENSIHQDNLGYESTSVKAMHDSMHKNRNVKRDSPYISIQLKELQPMFLKGSFFPQEAYYAEIFTGRDGQGMQMRLSIDVASTTTWVKSIRCTTCGPQQFLFDDSRTPPDAILRKKISMNDENLVGGVYRSNFIFNNGIGLPTHFLLADVVNVRHNDWRVQGSLGLGYIPKKKRISEKANWNIFSDAINSNYSPIFGLYLGLIESGTSHLTLGGIPSLSLEGSIEYHSQRGNPGPHWRVKIHSVMNLDKHWVRVYKNAIINTRIVPILGGIEEIESIYQGYQYRRLTYQAPGPGGIIMNNRYEIPCTQDLNFIFDIGDIIYEMNPLNMMLKGPFGNCFGALEGNYATNEWNLGTSFLRNVYIIFDLQNNQIGFQSLYSKIPETRPFFKETPGLDDIQDG